MAPKLRHAPGMTGYCGCVLRPRCEPGLAQGLPHITSLSPWSWTESMLSSCTQLPVD